MEEHTRAVAGVATLRTAEDYARLVARLGRSVEMIDGAVLEEFPDELARSFRRVRRLDPRGRSCWWVVEAESLDEGVARLLDKFVRSQAKRCASGTAVIIAVGGPRLGLWIALAEEPRAAAWRGRSTALDARAAEVWSALLTGEDPSMSAMRAHRILSKREVTRRFFREVRQALDALSKSWSSLATDDPPTRRQLSLTLLSRLMFLYFVQHKGWLDGDAGFMAATVLDPAAEDVYRSRLAPLFFDTLSVPRDARRQKRVGVPYLNGGLFEPTEVERANPDARPADAELRAIVGDVLESYRFVGRESGTEVGVDPAMLGTVFEELMGSEERGASGTFYTPPRLVSECVADALEPVLRQRVGERIWAKICDSAELSPRDVARVEDAISDLRVIDPAMGSGAFLLGVLEYLVGVLEKVSSEDRASLVRRVIATNLYGVDVSASAVTITELRLWLALVAASPDGRRHVEPLPNLDHHIRRGNSLFGTGAVVWLDGLQVEPRLMRSVREVTTRYADAHGADKVELDQERRRLERRLALELLRGRRARAEGAVEDFDRGRGEDLFGRSRRLSLAEERERRGLVSALAHADDALAAARRSERVESFDFRSAFAPTMARGGFDAVVGNPPWVRLSKLPAGERRRLRASYRWMRGGGGRGFGSQPDLAVAFVERSVQLLRPGGVLSLVVPGKLFTAGYARRMRAGIRAETAPLRLRDLATGEVALFSADVFPAVMVAQKEGETDVPVRVDDGAGRSGVALPRDLAVDDHPESPWPLLDGASMQAYRRLSVAAAPLAERRTIRLGIKTGANAVFVDPPGGVGPVVRALRGGDIAAMSGAPSARLLLAHQSTTGEPLSAVRDETLAYLRGVQSLIEGRADARPGDPIWRVHRVYRESLGHRVAWRDIGERVDAVYLPPISEGGPAVLNSAYLVAVDDVRQGLRLAAWLCSIPSRFAAAVSAERALGGYRRFIARNVGRVPVPDEVLEGSIELDALSRALHRNPADERAWRLLNQYACELLGLDRQMREAIGNHASRLSLSASGSLRW